MATKKMEKSEETTQAMEQPAEAVVDSLEALAQRHRVPMWQLGALLRFMGWEADKAVSDSDFTDALQRLAGRPLGGGRC